MNKKKNKSKKKGKQIKKNPSKKKITLYIPQEKPSISNKKNPAKGKTSPKYKKKSKQDRI